VSEEEEEKPKKNVGVFEKEVVEDFSGGWFAVAATEKERLRKSRRSRHYARGCTRKVWACEREKAQYYPPDHTLPRREGLNLPVWRD